MKQPTTTASTSFSVRNDKAFSPMRARTAYPTMNVLFDDDLGDLPDGSTVEGLAFQFRPTVERVDDEERPLVAHRHVFAVSLQSQDDIVLGEIFDWDFAAVIVKRHDGDAIARRSDLLHQLVEGHAFKLDRPVIPGRGRLHDLRAERFQHR